METNKASKLIRRNWPLWAAGLLLAAATAAVFCDSAWAVMCIEQCPEWLRKVLQGCVSFGDGWWVPFYAVVVVIVKQSNWASGVLVAACAWGAGLAADLGKLCIDRLRPNHFDLTQSGWESFQGLFLFSHDFSHQSMPSGHTATAVGLAVVLSRLFPRISPLFAMAAVSVACQRMVTGAHYLSDTLAGAAVGLAAAHGIYCALERLCLGDKVKA